MAAALVVAAIAAGAAPASAKGAVEARVTAGPGIDAPIVVRDRKTVHDLAQMSGLYEMAYGGDLTSVIDRPAGDLGPRYVIEITVALSGGAPAIRQQLYPYAGGGPVVHTPGGQLLEQLDPEGKRACAVCKKTTDVWRTSSPELYRVLHELDLPQPRTALAAVTASTPRRSGWRTVHNVDHDVTLRAPDDWNAVDSVMLPVQVDPVMPLAVGTAAVEPQPVGECGIVPQRALEAVGPEDVFVGIYVTAGLASWGATVPQRPESFASKLPWGLGPMKCTGNVDARLHALAFAEHGVKLTVVVATGSEISDERRAALIAVLDSLEVGRR